MYAALLNNELVNANDQAKKLKNKQINDQNNHYFCPHCKQEVQLIVKEKSAYFKHRAHIVNLSGEKEEHLQSKNLLQAALIEANFPAQTEISLAKGQLRADVLANSKLAFEIQCAPLNKSEFRHRHFLYWRSGIQDIWVVGKRHFLQHNIKKSQLIFFRKNKLWHNYYLEIDPYQKRLRLKFNVLLEPLTEQVHYQVANFALNGTGLQKLWRFHPQLKNYNIDPSKQQRYLQIQLTQKSIKGMQIATLLYQSHLTLNDLPEWVFTKLRPVSAPDNVTAFLHQP